MYLYDYILYTYIKRGGKNTGKGPFLTFNNRIKVIYQDTNNKQKNKV